MKRRIVIFLIGYFGWLLQGSAAPTRLFDQEPVHIEQLKSGAYLVDFGRVAFGNLRVLPSVNSEARVTFHFGEALSEGRVNRKPPGSVRYSQSTARLIGDSSVVVAPPQNRRNTQTNHPSNPPAILTPPHWGVIAPFRWVEIEGWPGELLPEQVMRQSVFASTWDDEAASFESSDELLNQIWELCRYSIKATTFAGVYVDGDRERIPYEADAYLNQLSHYYTDNDIQMARDTIDHLLIYETWPSEWAPHMVFMVYADWMQTGDTQWMAGRYDALKSKTLSDRRQADGLVGSDVKQVARIDIVDWPKRERDGYVFTSRNTVVNAFHLRAIALMGKMARALGKDNEADEYESDFRVSDERFQATFFDTKTGLYTDGIDTTHSSVHANLFSLAFGIVPEGKRAAIAHWLSSRGMRCSVYAAQYLLEGLFENGAGQQAIEMITAKNDRSWRHMVESGTTITWEAWDQKYKPNQDWNHAWGAAPANLFPRYILGAQPLEPGWELVRIRPHTAGLSSARGKVPTPRGPVLIDWVSSETFTLSLSLSETMRVRLELPAVEACTGVYRESLPVEFERIDDRLVLDIEASGTVVFEVK
ncbi:MULTISPECIES: family 78 glycoside hydrolase catalytic domain [unclassified Lentimonas]|uniref:family 78 glycoside hydrolase catalytic domain n=1 Tax=unclassified Lentimonas TaxID=2630993 RepID=UPI00132A8FD8|nr:MULTISPECIES: family 78 glycoside hydrolase catalytic domain [unclassified Lentimonas]CAA6692174.1 Unannotated [Lentimonas sp. CC10]CAA6696455.1 Unannotated [Lentimonas sp. CC19]CAA7071884.1 Unannotated [Lentimonas sp. CC11]